MTVTKKAAVPDSSIGVDVEQPLTNNNNEIITDSKKQINQQATNNVIANVVRGGENDLKTISMEELYDTAYPPRVPIVEGLIFNGTYLFVGAPKVGKSFFMAQLGYHVSMGIPLWGFPVTKGTVLYLALEDDYARLQRRLSKMFGMEGSSNLHFATQSKALNQGLEEQLHKFVKEHVNFEPDWVLKTFTDSFKETHGVECVAALHHNKKKTNYHIHLIFSERTMLEEPDIKIASRNMFYDEHGKHVRTKKELLDEQGNMRSGCTIIAKGEVYEKRLFSNKISHFKSDVFLESEKKRYTDLINLYIKNPLEQLQVFDKSGVYLPMKKIGKKNPKAAEIIADNQARKKWNQAVDVALVEGVPEADIKEIKKMEISKKVGQSIAVNGRNPGLFLQIIMRAKVILMNLLSKQKLPPQPKITVDITEFRKMQGIKQDLDKQVRIIRHIEEKELPDLLQQSGKLKGIFKSKERKEVEKQIEIAQNRVSDLKSYLAKAVTRYGYKNIQSFIKLYSLFMVMMI